MGLALSYDYNFITEISGSEKKQILMFRNNFFGGTSKLSSECLCKDSDYVWMMKLLNDDGIFFLYFWVALPQWEMPDVLKEKKKL